MTTEERRDIPQMPGNNDKHENGNPKKKRALPDLKFLLIAAICLAFLIPQHLIRNLVSERQITEKSAETEVFDKWGGSQTVIGPVIKASYLNDGAEKPITVLLLPEKLDINGDVSTKVLKRGIYDFSVYETDINLTGQFKLPKNFESQMEGKTWYFEDAMVMVDIANVKGLRENVTLNLSGNTYEMEVGDEGWGLSCPVNLSSLLEGETLDFSLTLSFKGSGNLMFEPVGQTTTVNLNSDCTTPSFNGCYLPDERYVDNTGFQASWKILAINRDYPQLQERPGKNEPYAFNSAFGVELKVPVEQYLKTDRSIKYAFLIILLTFAAVFFIEMRRTTPVHPVQYALVGIALIVFYTLLLSFSEHFAFGFSYLIASVMTIGLIVAFMISVTKSWKTGLGIGALLSVLYTFVFVLLQLESYALLVGSVGVFVILAIAMFASQKIEWYKKKD